MGEKAEVKLAIQTLSYKQISLGNVVYSTENVVNNISITLHSDKWLLDLLWWSQHKVYKCQIALSYT